MNQNPQLEDFAIAVERLGEKSLSETAFLEVALGANIASLRAMKPLDEWGLKNREACFEYATDYKILVGLCLKEFQERIPWLNGQAWHVDLYRIQMGVRAGLVTNWVNRMYPARN